MRWRRQRAVSFATDKRHALAEGLARSSPAHEPSLGDAGLGVRLAVAYALLSAVGLGLSFAVRGASPFVHPDPWIVLAPLVGVSASAAAGVALAFLITVVTRFSSARFSWARRLSGELRPFARSLTPTQVLLVSGLSSLGEEILFRGFLAPLLGVILSSAVFGLAHQMRGPSRWVWVAWATVAGLAFGLLYRLTGSLVGPLVAHALANAANLAFLKGEAESGVGTSGRD